MNGHDVRCWDYKKNGKKGTLGLTSTRELTKVLGRSVLRVKLFLVKFSYVIPKKN